MLPEHRHAAGARPARWTSRSSTVYPYVVVSTDFIKSDRRRDDFLRACPELVIVDEAHTCAWRRRRAGGRHQRHQLVRGLAGRRRPAPDPGDGHAAQRQGGAFRSLLALLDPSFADLPDDLGGDANEPHPPRSSPRTSSSGGAATSGTTSQTDTPFPEREEDRGDATRSRPSTGGSSTGCCATPARPVATAERDRHRQRVRWWSALALLRSLASSPAAAAATLRERAGVADTETDEEADEIGRRTVLDLDDGRRRRGASTSPRAATSASTRATPSAHRRRLLEMAREAEALAGDEGREAQDGDPQLVARPRSQDGYQPIVFCRFIPTAEYVAEHLRDGSRRDVEVAAVTGQLPPDGARGPRRRARRGRRGACWSAPTA